MTRTIVVLGLALCLLTGCPKSRDGGGGGGDVPFESLPAEQIAAFCDYIFRCEFSDDDTAFLKVALGDRSSCITQLTTIFEAQGQLAQFEDAIASGTVSYDAAAARACLDSIRSGCAGSVGGFDPGGSVCDTVFNGTVAEGGDCYIDEECSGGLSCDFGAGTCPGTCTSDPTGFSCGGVVCATDQECYFPPSGTERCVTVVFESDASAGEPCGLVMETTDTLTRRACAPGLFCSGDESTIGMCRAPVAAGAACTAGEVCAGGTVCVEGSCREVTVVRTEGGPCDETMLQFCDPFLRLECVSGTCATFTDGRMGSPCRGGDFGEVTCNAGLVCHRDTMTCGAPKAAGATCESDSECATKSCDHDTNTCRDHYCDL